MINAVLIGNHVAANHLSINPCIKINKGIDALGRSTCGDITIVTSVDYYSNGTKYNAAASPQVNTTVNQGSIDADHWHVHSTIALAHAIDLGSNVTITIQLQTRDAASNVYDVSDPDEKTYIAALVKHPHG